MKHRLFICSSCMFILSFFIMGCSNNGGLYIREYKNIKGYVIGNETCNSDETKDYWIISFTYGSNNSKVGDTLILNGISYTNVLKTRELADQLKKVGLSVSLDYNSISTSRIITTGCNVTNPVTYQLKEVTITNQFEIR